MSDYLCNDCLDTGWIEDREGKTVCACISETEPYQLLRAEVEALRKLADDLYLIMPGQPGHGDISREQRTRADYAALRGEGE